MKARQTSRWRFPTAVLIAFLGRAVGASEDPAGANAAAATSVEREFRGALSISLLAGALASTALPSEVFKKPPDCRWCGGANPNVIDRWAAGARWENRCRAGRLSYATMSVAAGLAIGPLSHESRARDWLENAGAVTDSVAVTVMATQIVKYVVRRERPAADTCHPERSPEPDRNLSFISGHAAVAFALISSAHETARLRGRRSNDAWLWAGGGAAALTGYLRVAGERHHLIDVLAGAGVGYAIGKWIPRHVLPPDRRSLAPVRSTAAPLPPPLFGYTRAFTSEGKVVVQLGKGPGRSLQVGIRF